MRNAVQLDTSFLITLADPRRDRHATAKQFFQYFAEFCRRQDLNTLPFEQLMLVPFNHEDAVVSSKELRPVMDLGSCRTGKCPKYSPSADSSLTEGIN